MSACTPFRELMLEADPAELRGEGNGALARHLRACAPCARVAALLLEETARLDALLEEAPHVDVAGILARAGVSSAPPAPAPEAARSATAAARSVPDAVGTRFPRRRLWIPMAAAAALAAILLLRVPSVRPPRASVAAAAERPAPPLVEPAAGQNAAILRTDDPEITVIWLFPTG
ncbi:MAG: hypothetical protein LJF06_14645 [Gemmatimonadetes bacterium]|nr:hypothetical protein [Gemmatimonadota bacterium]